LSGENLTLKFDSDSLIHPCCTLSQIDHTNAQLDNFKQCFISYDRNLCYPIRKCL